MTWIHEIKEHLNRELVRRKRNNENCDASSISRLIAELVEYQIAEYRRMQKIPDVGALSHEVAAEALQRWLWSCVAAGWDPSLRENPRWTHEDNNEAQKLGWMIAQPPGSGHLDLFSLGRLSPADLMRHIVSMAPHLPLCAKAVMVLSAQRLENPNIRFNFSSDHHMVTR